jgi:hypothetical protein
MDTHEKVGAWVDPQKVLEWEGSTPIHEGIISINQMLEEAEKLCSWLLFYSWCYARTQGFTNKCMRDWDYGNFGGKYKTSRGGIKDALSEFIKYSDTSELAEQKEVEKLYGEIDAYCKGVVWSEPHPLPEPQPEPKPEPDEPSEDGHSQPFNWVKSLKILAPILATVRTLGGMFLPGWAKTIIDMILKVISGIMG